CSWMQNIGFFKHLILNSQNITVLRKTSFTYLLEGKLVLWEHLLQQGFSHLLQLQGFSLSPSQVLYT
ncbi:hypothetical protein ACJMK2_033772, partial [Sinanodonta woodiana]